MKRSWVAVVIAVLLGALAGVAIAGRPTSVDQTPIIAPPATTAATTTLLSTSATTSSSTLPAATTTSAANTTSSSVAPVERSAVRVLVANGADRPGIARSTADVLVAAGFTDSTPVDALSIAAVSVVYARPGFEAAAAEVAATLGLAANSALPLDTAITSDDGTGDVIAVIGADFQR